MASNFQSSFIPKGSVTQEPFKKRKTGVAGVLAVTLFIASIIGAGGMYAYKRIVKNDIQNLQSQLADAEKNIDKETINQMSQFNKKMDLAKSIVFRHQVISKFLEELASSTVVSIGFNDFNYGDIEEGNLSIILHGEATSYASIALQEDVFSKNKYFKLVSFSNLSLKDKGIVSFDLKILVDPQILVYSPPVVDELENVTNTENTETDVSDLSIDEMTDEINSIESEINNIEQ